MAGKTDTPAKRTPTSKQVSFQCPVELYPAFVQLQMLYGHRKDAGFVKMLVNDAAKAKGVDLELPVRP